jgi:hypothetical protein
MSAQEHSTLREGITAGLAGAVIVAAWFLVFDVMAGRPFHTFNVLGKVLFRGDLDPGVRNIVPGIVAAFTILHLALYVAAGTLLTYLVHLASRNLSLRMGLWLGIVVSFMILAGATLFLNLATEERVPLWELIAGSLLGVGVMSWYLMSRHPAVRSSAPLGAEGKTPKHAPGAPRG